MKENKNVYNKLEELIQYAEDVDILENINSEDINYEYDTDCEEKSMYIDENI